MTSQIENFTLIAELKRSQTVSVYRAYDRSASRLALVKILRTPDRAARQRFVQETEILARLSHSNIVRIIKHGESAIAGGKSVPFLATEFIEGTTLAGLLEKHRLPLDLSLFIISEILAALHYAHRQQVIHRDIKPQNILIDQQGSVKVTDFGMAAIAGAPSEHGVIIGTPQYMAPEQARGEAPTTASDMFSLGVILYEMLSGVSPFDGNSVQERLYRVLHEEPPSLRHSLNGASPDLYSFIERLLQKDKHQRPSSAGEIQRELVVATNRMSMLADRSCLRSFLESPHDYRPKRRSDQSLSKSSQRRVWKSAAFLTLVMLGVSGAYLVRQPKLAHEPNAGGNSSDSLRALAAPLDHSEEQPRVGLEEVEELSVQSPITADNELSNQHENSREPIESTMAPEIDNLMTAEVPTAISHLQLSCWPVATAVLGGDTLGQIEIAAKLFEVTAGEHELILLNPKFPPHHTRVSLTTHDTASLKISLWETIATLTLHVQPWAEVYLDSAYHGITPLTEIMVAPGEHTIELRHPERQVFTTRRSFFAGQRDTLIVELVP